MPNLLPMLRILAPTSLTLSAILIIALNPHSATFAFWLMLPVNAAGWPGSSQQGGLPSFS